MTNHTYLNRPIDLIPFIRLAERQNRIHGLISKHNNDNAVGTS